MKMGLGLVLFLVVLSGCAASPPSSLVSNTLVGTDNSADTLLPPSKPLVYCDSPDLEQNEECFEEALLHCEPAVGRFWKTMDDFPLILETVGIDDSTQKCGVRVTIPSDSQSQFKGQTATCMLERKPAMSNEALLVYDIYDIGPKNCSGTYLVALQEDAAKKEQTPNQPPAEPPVNISHPETNEFSFTVSDSHGVEGSKEFVVNQGDAVVFHVTVSTTDSSWGGNWVRGPAGNKLSDESQYIFTTGNIPPGQTKTVQFTATQSFEFGVYWPNSNVLKGTAKVTVNET